MSSASLSLRAECFADASANANPACLTQQASVMTIPRPVTAVSGPDPTAPEAIKRKSGKKVIAVAVVAMLLVAGGLIFFFNSGNQGGTPGETYTTIGPEDEKVLLVDEADRHCVYLSGDFYSTNNGQPALSASFNSAGKLKVEIATAYAQQYATFKWELSGENNFKTESPALKTNYYNAFTTFGFGSYNVQVKCTAADGSSMIFGGDIASYVYYQWVYQNDIYSTIGIVSYEEYYNYTNSMAPRRADRLVLRCHLLVRAYRRLCECALGEPARALR